LIDQTRIEQTFEVREGINCIRTLNIKLTRDAKLVLTGHATQSSNGHGFGPSAELGSTRQVSQNYNEKQYFQVSDIFRQTHSFDACFGLSWLLRTTALSISCLAD
jgi:hypothetical protein